MKKILYIALSVTIIAGALVAGSCANTNTSTTPPDTGTSTPTPGGNFAITIQGEAFSPVSVNVPAGTTVTWTNMDSTTHTVTSDTGLFDSKNMSRGSNFSHTFSDKGTFTYHCTIHTNMKGTVNVE